MEKNILNDICDDENDNDLNKAKLSLNNDNSLIIENVNNITAPHNFRKSDGLEIEYLIFKNHNQPHNLSSSSFSNFNLTNINNIEKGQTYIEGNTNNTNHYQSKKNLQVLNQEKTSVNNTSENHTLSLSEYSSHSSYSNRGKGITLNNGNSGLLNNNINYTNIHHLNYLKYNETDIFSNNIHNLNKNKILGNNNYYQANSFCFDQNQQTFNYNQLNHNSTYSGYANSNFIFYKSE